MVDSVQKKRTTNFYITKNTDAFTRFLINTNIFDRLLTLSPNYIQHYKDINRQIIADHIKTLNELPIGERIPKLEDKYMERKASFKFNTLTKGSDVEREKAVSKAIAGFSNSDGGILFIGVDKNGNLLGLKNDYRLVKDHNADGFQLELRSSIKSFLKNNLINDIIDIRIHKINGEEICEIVVHPSPVPIILVHNGKEEFYVREGNSTKPYILNSAIEYCLRHFNPQ
jgi:predicted HTH transcriptional regulator